MTGLEFEKNDSREIVFATVAQYLGRMSLGHTAVDSVRPWGGFYVIEESQTSDFIDAYFPEVQNDIGRGVRLSPKILIVEPDKRLSWQYHNRRDELWKVIKGPVGVVTSPDNTQQPVDKLETGRTVQFGNQTRHRLIGLNDWGIVAEIWQHTDPNNPSNENDIIRVEDDFGR